MGMEGLATAYVICRFEETDNGPLFQLFIHPRWCKAEPFTYLHTTVPNPQSNFYRVSISHLFV